MLKKIYKITGMDCASCASVLEMDLEDAGIASKCSYIKSELLIVGEHDQDRLNEIVKKSGFAIK